MGFFGAVYSLTKWTLVIAVCVLVGYVLGNTAGHPRGEHFSGPKCPASDGGLTIAQRIVRTYMSTLERMPTELELKFYRKKYARKFNEGQLITLLQGSDEYVRSQNLQTNVYQPSTRARSGGKGDFGLLTDSQIDSYIAQLYAKVYGDSMDADTRKYLRAKYQALGQDCAKFNAYLKRLKKLEASSNTPPGGADSGREACVLQRDRQPMADMLKKRRGQDASCGSNKSWMTKNLVLMDGLQWTVPQKRPPVCVPTSRACIVRPSTDQTGLIGTLLTDAKRTKVGSMMPKFKYIEETGRCPRESKS